MKTEKKNDEKKAVTPLCKRHGCILEIGCYRMRDGGASSSSGGGLPHPEPHPEPSGSSESE